VTAGATRGAPQGAAVSLKRFRAGIAHGMERADLATTRAFVELLVERVMVDAPEVECAT
jgi:hypothetical protein